MPGRYTKDLIVLLADKNAQFAIDGVLQRPESLRIRPISRDIYVHPESDPGCLRAADDFLRAFVKKYAHALVVFDRRGCGREETPRTRIEADLESRLARSGWGTRAATIIIDPELEIWVWADSPHVEEVLGWRGQDPSLRDWLLEKRHLLQGESKPRNPKEAVQLALWMAKKQRSSAIYRQLAQRVSLARCQDPSFVKLRDLLQNWFPQTGGDAATRS